MALSILSGLTPPVGVEFRPASNNIVTEKQKGNCEAARSTQHTERGFKSRFPDLIAEKFWENHL